MKENPAAPRICFTVGGSASENGSGLAATAATDPSGPARDWRIETSHSLRSWACQTIITRRPAGRRARRMLSNAATGSSKNIVPNLLITRSNRSRGKRWICTLACSKVTLRSLSARASSRARSMAGAEMSTPERATCAGCARGVASRLPGPTSDVEDAVVKLDSTGPAQYLVVPPQLGVVTAEGGRMVACGASRRNAFATVGVVWALLVTGFHQNGTPPLSRARVGSGQTLTARRDVIGLFGSAQVISK